MAWNLRKSSLEVGGFSHARLRPDIKLYMYFCIQEIRGNNLASNNGPTDGNKPSLLTNLKEGFIHLAGRYKRVTIYEPERLTKELQT